MIELVVLRSQWVLSNQVQNYAFLLQIFSTTFYHHVVSRPLLEANAQKVKLLPFNGSLAETIM